MDKIQDEQMIKQERGITLIALIITIIVLLILAGVSIAMLTGENGILDKAETAEFEQSQAELIEGLTLALSESFLNENVEIQYEHNVREVLQIAQKNGYISDETHYIEVLETESAIAVQSVTVNYTLIDDIGDEVTKVVVSNKKTSAYAIVHLNNGKMNIEGGSMDDNITPPATATDPDPDPEPEPEPEPELDLDPSTTPPIPDGFQVPEDTTSDPLEDRDTIEEGFVIEDSDGNQFVWVPADPETSEATKRLLAVTADGTYTSTSTIYGVSLLEPKYLSDTQYGDATSYNKTLSSLVCKFY